MFTKGFLQQIEVFFQEKLEQVGEKRKEIETLLAHCTEDEAEALKCLYASMPVNDVTDYSPELFLSYAKHGVFLWYEGPFAGKIPEDIFAGYVLYHRLGIENITDCRPFFYNILKDEIAGMTMAQAAIQLNYWCASQVTYQTTDPRTAGPESLYRSGYGRCGEESIFGAFIFRTMGIPARQVMAPLWSHCDDNHAWVEVWCDGEWKFLGACEPELILNKGWFRNPTTRAMMLQANWHLPIMPENAILGRDASDLVVNELSNYAETKYLEVSVVDQAGNPLPDVTVYFGVFNYGFFGNVAALHTDDNGKARLETGYGSLLVSIHENEICTEMLVNTCEQDTCTLVAGTKTDKLDEWEDFVVYAPVASMKNYTRLTPEQVVESEMRVEEAAASLAKKVEAFYDAEVAEKAIEGYTEEEKIRCREIMKLACGNMHEIAKFLAKDPEGKYPHEWKLAILNTLYEKDFVDVTCKILEEHCEMTAPYADLFDKDVLYKFVLCPRVDFEYIYEYRRFIMSWLTEEQKELFRKAPIEAWNYINTILKSSKRMERGRIIATTRGSLILGYGNKKTKKVVCVKLLRTLGVPARINPTDHMVEAWIDGAFVHLEKPIDVSGGRTAVIRIHESEGVKWIYEQNLMIEKLEHGHYRPIMIPMNKDHFDGTVKIFPGRYRVYTSNRLPNGNSFVKKYVFEVNDGETKDIYLQQTPVTIEDIVERHKVTDFEFTKEDGTKCMMSELVKENKGVFIWLQVRKEPTEHVLNEMYEMSESFQNLENVKIYFVLRDKSAKDDVTLNHTMTKVTNVEFVYDDFTDAMENLAGELYKDPGEYPLIAVMDENMTSLFSVVGYSVGSVNMVLRVLEGVK